jgi:hypothetical protein
MRARSPHLSTTLPVSFRATVFQMNGFAPAPVAAIKFVWMLVAVAGLALVAGARADVVINPNFPIRGPSNLSPPRIAVTNECSTHVYVQSFVPGATIKVYLSGSILIGGPIAPPFGFRGYSHRNVAGNDPAVWFGEEAISEIAMPPR